MKVHLLIVGGLALGFCLANAAPVPTGKGAVVVENLAPLPEQPLLPGEISGSRLMPDEILLPSLVPAPVNEAPRYKLDLAIDAMQPVLPPLNLAGADSLVNQLRVVVKRFEFSGNTIFSDAKLRKCVARYVGRSITAEELEEARVELTHLYVDAGFINSGAVLPDQDVKSGVIQFQIVEGRMTEIDLHGNFWFRPWWYRHQLRRAAGQPVNFNRLKTGLQILRQNPGIRQINAELKPGVKPGESILHVTVKDNQPFRFGVEINNTRPPSVGEGNGEVYFADLNLTGHSDPLSVRWSPVGWTKDGTVDYHEFSDIEGSYEFPISPWETTLRIHASRGASSIIDETFAALGITSKATEWGLTLRQPIYQTLANGIAASFSVDRKSSETFLLGRPFTLSAGAVDGQTDVFATRLSLEWTNRSQLHVLSLRATFSVGFYALDSTENIAGSDGLGLIDLPDSKFFSWLGQAQFVQRIFDTPTIRKQPDNYLWNTLRESLLALRANCQFSDDPLLSLEQFSIGGVQSVRGYRENQLLRDNGVFASAELRIPIWLNKEKTPLVTLVPFFDYGIGWDTQTFLNESQTIYSAGVGLLLNFNKHAQAAIYWGHPFVELQKTKESLQDYGISFAISFNAF